MPTCADSTPKELKCAPSPVYSRPTRNWGCGYVAIGTREVTVHLGEGVVLLGPVDLDLQDVAVLMGFDVGHVRRLFLQGQ